MKTTLDGDLIGFCRMVNSLYVLSCQNDYKGEFGYELRHRIMFRGCTANAFEEYKRGFRRAIGLPDECYELQAPCGSGEIETESLTGSVFWRTFWLKGSLPVQTLKDAEDALAALAENMGLGIVLVGLEIIPVARNVIQNRLARKKSQV